MRLLHYVEIEHFKGFGERQRIELDHPAVLIGPNNCGKTTVIQAIALWSQAVKTWFDAKGRSPPKERTATSLNRLNIVSVPVQRTRYFWHNTVVRSGNRNISLLITVGFQHGIEVVPVTMRFRNQGDELVYCTPDAETLARPEVVEAAARLDVELLYPMSGLETEEPILQPGRIDVLLGQGQTAQVLRNLCLLVFKSTPEDWQEIQRLMERLFDVRLGKPTETARGSIDLLYRQRQVKEALDVSLAGRGLQQMLLIFAYLYSYRGSVLLIDEPDAHLEILRQKQVYVLLEDIARRNGSQVILVTHSEVILDEALGRNLTLLMGGRAGGRTTSCWPSVHETALGMTEAGAWRSGRCGSSAPRSIPVWHKVVGRLLASAGQAGSPPCSMKSRSAGQAGSPPCSMKSRSAGQAGSPPCSMKSRSIFGSGRSLIAASKAWSRL